MFMIIGNDMSMYFRTEKYCHNTNQLLVLCQTPLMQKLQFKKGELQKFHWNQISSSAFLKHLMSIPIHETSALNVSQVLFKTSAQLFSLGLMLGSSN